MRRVIVVTVLILVLGALVLVPALGQAHPPDGQGLVHCHVRDQQGSGDAALYVQPPWPVPGGGTGPAVGLHGNTDNPTSIGPVVILPGQPNPYASGPPCDLQ